MRHAAWRRSPDDPTTSLSLLKRWPIELYEAQACYDFLDANFGLSLMFWVLFLIIAFPVLSASAALLVYGWAYGVITFFGAIAFELLLGRLWDVVDSWLGHEKQPSTLSQLATLPPPEKTYPVRVAIRYRGVLTGTDVAIASFAEDWLVIEGSRMSCSLASNDGRGRWRKAQLWIDLPYGGSLALRRVYNPEFPSCRVTGPRHLWRDFEDDAKDWSRGKPPAEGESVLPPLTTHWTMRRGWLGLTTVSLALAAGSFALLIHTGGFLPPVLLAFAILGGWSFVRGLVVWRRQNAADHRAQTLETHSQNVSLT